MLISPYGCVSRWVRPFWGKAPSAKGGDGGKKKDAVVEAAVDAAPSGGDPLPVALEADGFAGWRGRAIRDEDLAAGPSDPRHLSRKPLERFLRGLFRRRRSICSASRSLSFRVSSQRHLSDAGMIRLGTACFRSQPTMQPECRQAEAPDFHQRRR